MRYFRLSQLSDDIFDAYRYTFLALEAALDATIPAGAPGGEAAWLKFGLRNLHSTFGVDITNYLLAAPGPDPIQQFMDEQYIARRCAVFHAKQTAAGALMPGVAADRRTIATALEPLVRLVLDVSSQAFNARFPAGGMVIGGFVVTLRNVVGHQYHLALTTLPDARSDVTLAEVVATDPDILPLKDIGKLDSVGLEHGFVADIDTAHLHRVSFNAVTSYTAHEMPGGITTIWTPNGYLSHHHLPVIDLRGVNRLQVVVRWILDNQQMPRSRFTL